ncbi:MAG: hypothetical protein ACO1RX_05075 [Candidatus Sericytochromatia bacterium]
MNPTDAPLAQTDLSSLSGLTLEDLDRLHGDPALPPSTLETDMPGPEAQSEADLAEAQQGVDTGNWLEDMAPTPEQELRKALLLTLEGEQYHLDQKDDLRRLAPLTQTLLETRLPEALQRLGQWLHAREQSNHLYDRLAELSERRGAAATIIQTAKQIETVEKSLQGDQVPAAELEQLDQDLAQLAELIDRYRAICQLAQQL